MAAVAMMTTGLCADRRESARERVLHHATAVMYRDIGLCEPHV